MPISLSCLLGWLYIKRILGIITSFKCWVDIPQNGGNGISVDARREAPVKSKQTNRDGPFTTHQSFQGDTSVVATFVLCFGVEFLCCLNLIM